MRDLLPVRVVVPSALFLLTAETISPRIRRLLIGMSNVVATDWPGQRASLQNNKSASTDGLYGRLLWRPRMGPMSAKTITKWRKTQYLSVVISPEGKHHFLRFRRALRNSQEKATLIHTGVSKMLYSIADHLLQLETRLVILDFLPALVCQVWPTRGDGMANSFRMYTEYHSSVTCCNAKSKSEFIKRIVLL